ncbi:MAG: phosphoribosyl-ATP diphosphatase [Rhodospirillales bacterium]|nr:phosphoribosyl-ATP diphosphatase [Rhodospirillales bacterium]
MAKSIKKRPDKRTKAAPKGSKTAPKASKAATKPRNGKATKPRKALPVGAHLPPLAIGHAASVLDRLYAVVLSRRDADPAVSHSARLLSRGTAKVAQKFGEEAVECLIEAVAGNRDALVAESADVLYHLLVLWVASGVAPEEVWTELRRREGISGIAEKASRAKALPARVGLETSKIP